MAKKLMIWLVTAVLISLCLLPAIPVVQAATPQYLDLGEPIEGGLGDWQMYWDLSKHVAVISTGNEALRLYGRDLAFTQSEAGGGLKDYGEQPKPAGNQTVAASPVLNMYQEKMEVKVGHLYLVKTKSLGYFALYMDDIQEVKGTIYMAFTLYKLATAPSSTSPAQPNQPNQPTQPTQSSQPTQPDSGLLGKLTVAADDGLVKLAWTAPVGKTPIGYYVYRGTGSGKYDSMPLSDFPTKATEYTDAKVEIGKTYYYTVKAVWSDYTLSQPSNEVAVQVVAAAITEVRTEIWLQVDNPRARVDGKWQDLQASPRLYGERVIVPFRFIGQSIGAEIGYLGDEQKVTYKLGDLFIELWLNQTRVRVNGQESNLDVAPMLVDGQYTFVPLRFVATQLGAQLNWNPDDSSVTIVSVRKEQANPAVPEKTVSRQFPYWVEGGVRLVIDGAVAYEDAEGIYSPAINPEGTLIAYSHGGNQMILGSSQGENAVAYEHPDANYRVYPMTWSGDGTEILFLTSYSGGFTGGNQVGILNFDTEKVTWVYKGATAADWAADGRIVVGTVSDLLIVDRRGRTITDLTPVQGGMFTYADDPTFSPDGQLLIYQLGKDFYLHDIATDKYSKAISTGYEGDPARIATDGRIIYVDKKIVKVYDAGSGETKTISKSTDCSYPGWMGE